MIKIYCVGKIKEDWLDSLLKEEQKKINKKRKIEIIEIKDVECPQHYSPAQQEQVKNQECAILLQKIGSDEYVVALDLEGKKLSSKDFQELVKSKQKLSFVIGGSLGLSDELKKRANQWIKLSDMTFTHQFARLMLLEQISKE